MEALEITGLKKAFGKRQILKDISFQVGEQEIVGFLGPNGSGKSTTIKCICGLYRMTEGEIKIHGYDIQRQRKEALRELGASIESPALYPQLTGQEHLRLMGKWRGANKARIRQMEEYTGLEERLKYRAGSYSMGMKMRLMLAMTLMAKPSLIILDEPTNGLDPQSVFELRKQMEQIRRDGSAILFSSHQLAEVEKLADRVVILDQGQKIYDGVIPEHAANGTEYQVKVRDAQETFCRMTAEGMACRRTDGAEDSLTFCVQNGQSFAQIYAALGRAGADVLDIVKCETGLEDFYKMIYEERYSDAQIDTK